MNILRRRGPHNHRKYDIGIAYARVGIEKNMAEANYQQTSQAKSPAAIDDAVASFGCE